ncbi:MAG: hypothetical protein JXQ73_13775 [Phycisphaerae bacterium]|nr:hypothetical protein [Phycisphaerae bacterium]
MLRVGDPALYQRHREARKTGSSSWLGSREFWAAVLLFGSAGAITWAIRGTDGWGGVDGTIVPGMTWGLLWYYVCCRKGIDARGIPLWLGLGIAVGGELGYGQYVSWIQGEFDVGEGKIPIAPWVGYAWFVICGIGWGATGGIALGWALGGRASPGRWLVRILVPIGVGLAGWELVQLRPGWFFPNHGLGIYAEELDRHLERTVYTNTQNFVVLAWWVGALVVAAIQRDRPTLVVGALIGGGFGIGFALGAVWCLGYSQAPGYIDWWKMWELNAGFNLGVLYVVALYWSVRQVDRRYGCDGVALAEQGAPAKAPDRRRDLSLTVSVFLLLLVTSWGASLRIGSVLGLYNSKAIDQYEWPVGRIAVFAPVAAIIVGATVRSLWRIVRSPAAGARHWGQGHLSDRVADLITGLGVIGVVTIWPSKIAVLYAVFVFLAILALNRLNRCLSGIDAGVARC